MRSSPPPVRTKVAVRVTHQDVTPGYRHTLPRAMIEDLCNIGGTKFPTMMPEDAHNIVIGIGQSIHHREESDQTY